MQSPEFQREEAIKTNRGQDKATPRADRGNALGWASTLGNAAVQRLLRSLGVQRSSAGSAGLDESIGRAIQAKRGTGQGLDSDARRELEPVMGQDFSDVRVHADSDADALNRAVQAEAFTTGHDIFFRSGKYNPGSSEGRKLLTHELTHVVQQREAPPAQELTVSSPDDASERQASATAEHIGASTPSVAPGVGRQAAPEEEEEVAPSLERQAAPEEEEQVAASLERQAAPEEEEEVAAALERQEAPEEEEEPAG